MNTPNEFPWAQARVSKQISDMSEAGKALFTTDVDPDQLWDAYLNNFAEGDNPLFRKRTYHDCSCCRSFIKKYGGLVQLTAHGVMTVWDTVDKGIYSGPAQAMRDLVLQAGVNGVFYTDNKHAGTAKSRELTAYGGVRVWDHWYHEFDPKHVVRSPSTERGKAHNAYGPLYRALTELTVEAGETVLELIDQGSLYRGDEMRRTVEKFVKLRKDFDMVKGERQKKYFIWRILLQAPPIRNTSIGQLLTNLSEGKELDWSVAQYEAMVAPTNYKRTTALVTPGMVAKAKKQLEEAGLLDSITRRHASETNISVNDVFFVDRSSINIGDVFAKMAAEAPVYAKKLTKIEEVGIDDFLTKVVPTAETIDVLFEPRLKGKLMSLTAPTNTLLDSAPKLFAWDNNISWAYRGDLADSIKEKVKAAGGDVEGHMRVSLAWDYTDDLDIHVIPDECPGIYYGSMWCRTTYGQLDVDMNAGRVTSTTPVENVTWSEWNPSMKRTYKVLVKNFHKRDASGRGFDIEIEYDGSVTNLSYDKPLRNKDVVEVATIDVLRRDHHAITAKIANNMSQSVEWGMKTHTFKRVKLLTHSPNFWDDQEVGNEHIFFIIEGCTTDEDTRGFFNEQLNPGLREYRKVLEILGAKTKVPPQSSQLSGLGFSKTQRNHVYCRVTGKFTRTLKVNF